MTLKTSGERALILSQQWHHRAATHFSRDLEPETEFGPPWVPGANLDRYEIVPLTAQWMLEEEGRVMDHCVATYGRKVLNGRSYIFRCLKRGEPAATIELERDMRGGIRIAQARARQNGRPQKDVLAAIHNWFNDGPKAPMLPPALPGRFDDNIPF